MARKKWGIMVPFPSWTTPLWVTYSTADLGKPQRLTFDTEAEADAAARIWKTYRVRAFWETEQRKEDT